MSGASRFSRQYVVFRSIVPARRKDSWTEPVRRELTDEELLRMAEEDGHFDFLKDPAEDVYTWDDGEPL